MITAIIVDDEISNIENLQALIAKYCPQVNVVGSALNNATAAGLIKQHQPDLIFLDILLGNDSGLNLFELVQNRTFEVIFITAYDKYGIQAVKLAALDYLLKPVDIEEMINAVAKAEAKLKVKQHNQQLDFLVNYLKKGDSHPAKIALQQQKEIRYVDLSEIVRCEADNTYTFFYLNNGDRVLVSKGLKEYADSLPTTVFLRTHQSHIVNINFVKSWLKEDGGTLLLANGDKIPVSRPNREKVRSMLDRHSLWIAH